MRRSILVTFLSLPVLCHGASKFGSPALQQFNRDVAQTELLIQKMTETKVSNIQVVKASGIDLNDPVNFVCEAKRLKLDAQLQVVKVKFKPAPTDPPGAPKEGQYLFLGSVHKNSLDKAFDDKSAVGHSRVLSLENGKLGIRQHQMTFVRRQDPETKEYAAYLRLEREPTKGIDPRKDNNARVTREIIDYARSGFKSYQSTLQSNPEYDPKYERSGRIESTEIVPFKAEDFAQCPEPEQPQSSTVVSDAGDGLR